MNNADLIVEILKAAGVERGFGIPSGNVLPLMDSMRRAGMAFVLTSHEGAAGFAADVTGLVSGAPGLCIATLGPGATNLSTGIGGAWLDRSPLIAITCNLPTAQLGRRIQMWIDHHALFAPITKASLRLEPGKIAETVSEAIRLALSEPRGPVHLDLPEDVAVAPATESVPHPRPPGRAAPATTSDIAQAASMVAGATRPLAILGLSAMRMRDNTLLEALIDRHGIPFATTTMAKGLIDEEHPLSVGCIERGCRQVQRRFLQSADLIIGLGYDTVEVEYEAWIGERPLLHVDYQPADVDDSVRLEHQVIGDLDASIEAMIRNPPFANEWSRAEIEAHRKKFQEALRPAVAAFSPHSAIDIVREALPRNGILAFDVGAHTHQIASQWTTYEPNSFCITNGWSSMGIGLPAAIAAKLAHPERPVVCIIGDGCFRMTCGEVATARRLGLSLPIVVLNDGWLALIKVKQIRRQLPVFGTELGDEDYERPPAHYFGAPALGVDNGAALKTAIEQAFRSDGPTIIEVRVDSEHYLETVYD